VDRFNTTLGRVGRTVAYGLLGLVGTAAVVILLLNLTQPLQAVIYETVYLQIGPSEATETAVLTQFLAVGLVGISVPMVVGDYLSDGLKHRRALGIGIGLMASLFVGFLVVALPGVASFLTALVVLAVAAVGVPLLLRYRFDVRSGAIPAFVGGIPIVVLLLLAAGFGLGWGWGYVVTAQEIPAGEVDDPDAVVTFDDAPAFEEALFADCETDTDGRQVCRLMLRESDHEQSAARFMAEQGVRCPYQERQSGGRSDAFTARHDGAYYRVTCSPHGD
jgi:MFS family permease